MNLADIFSLKDDTKPNNITVRLLLLRIMREYKLSMITLKVALHFPNHEDLMLEKKILSIRRLRALPKSANHTKHFEGRKETKNVVCRGIIGSDFKSGEGRKR